MDTTTTATAPVIQLGGVEYLQLGDTEGRLALVPRVCVEALLRKGMATLTLVIPIAESGERGDWLTLADAAAQHVGDIDGLTLLQAKDRIRWACKSGRIVCEGHGRDRRIEPGSFAAWRLAERERDLDKADGAILRIPHQA